MRTTKLGRHRGRGGPIEKPRGILTRSPLIPTFLVLTVAAAAFLPGRLIPTLDRSNSNAPSIDIRPATPVNCIPGTDCSSRFDSNRPLVALTFDDCHESDAWERLLDALRATNVHATFFCNSSSARRQLDLVERTVREGHEIGSHGYDHRFLRGLGAPEIDEYFRADRDAWETIRDKTGVTRVDYFRPPYGAYDRRVGQSALREGMRLYIWDVDSEDWRERWTPRALRRVIRLPRPGSIVLLHVLDQTALAIPEIISGLRQRGLTPSTLTDVVASGGTPLPE